MGLEPLHISIDGGDQMVTYNLPSKFSGKASDPNVNATLDLASSYSYNWVCTDIVARDDCKNYNGDVIPFPANYTAEVGAAQFIPYHTCLLKLITKKAYSNGVVSEASSQIYLSIIDVNIG
jgi:hypothetical protein